MKIYCASLLHETHSFSPIPTGLESYRESFLFLPSTGEGADKLEIASPEGSLRARIKAAGHELIDGVHAAAIPSGPTIQKDYEFIRDEILETLCSSGPVDGILLFLHGAQIAQGYDDCEGDLLERMRKLVGPDVPIGVELDLHTNVTEKMIENASVIICCKEYPHIDFNERAGELLDIVEQTAQGVIAPVMVKSRIPLVGLFHTTRQPLRGFVDKLSELEKDDEILSISFAHGFGYADLSEMGANIIVVAKSDPAHAQKLADDLAEEIFSLREAIDAPLVNMESAINEALAADGAPVVIADTSDNPGGGAAGDSTFVLRELLERSIESAALAMIWDPGAVKIAARAGEGATLPMRIGGKTGPGSGNPLDVVATVLRVRDDARQKVFGNSTAIGPAAALQINGVSVIINSWRDQVHDVACFSEFDIDPTTKKLLVVKSAQHFHAAFAPISTKIIYAGTPGTVTPNLVELPFKHLTRPIWPIDEPPFDVFGRNWKP